MFWVDEDKHYTYVGFFITPLLSFETVSFLPVPVDIVPLPALAGGVYPDCLGMDRILANS